MRGLLIAVVGLSLTACALQRAELAKTAQESMVGLPKEQILACMGPPARQATAGATEVWSYDSGNGFQVADVVGDRYGGTAVSSRRFCTVNVVMAAGRVTAVNYLGPTGGLLTAGEQCAFAVEKCRSQ